MSPKLKTMPQLTLEQRYEISHLKKQGCNNKFVAEQIGVHPTTIKRELDRNSDKRNAIYKPKLAQEKTLLRHKNKTKHIRFTKQIKEFVMQWLREDYSPEQIVGKAKTLSIACVSIERIYQFIWLDKKQGGILYKHLRTLGKRYQKRGNTNNRRGQIPDRVGIDKRPEIVEKKERFGDLEIDLVIGKNHKGALLTINDRATGLLKMAYIKSKESKEVAQKTIQLLEPWIPFIHTITSDNGKEFTEHKQISQALNIDFYFAKPYHSWQRGANENLNGLVRQYFPKKHNFDTIKKEQVELANNKLNNRPRKRYNFFSPNQMFNQFIKQNSNVAFIY